MCYQIAFFNRFGGERTTTSVNVLSVVFFLVLVVATSTRTTDAMMINKHVQQQRPFGLTRLQYRSEYNVAFDTPPTAEVLQQQQQQPSSKTMTRTTKVEEITTTTTTTDDDMMIPQASSFEEYHSQVFDERERLVVVRFHSPFCKACKAIKPRYNRFLSKYPSVKFVDVPVTSDNTEIHESLGIESLPHGVIYHPGQGLVESSKMNTNVIRYFEKMIKSYVQESCPLPDFNDDTQRYDSPYPRGMFIKSRRLQPLSP